MAYTPSLLRHKAFGMSESDRSVPTSLVNLDLYPIADTTSGSGKAFADRCQREYAESGLCILPEFISEKPLKRLAQEANKLQRHAYFCKSVHNAYLTDTDSTPPVDDACLLYTSPSPRDS